MKRGNGTVYKTEFFQCAGCSVVFLDAVKFTQFEPYKLPEQTEAHRAREAARLEYFRNGQGDR